MDTYHVAFMLNNDTMATYPTALPQRSFDDALSLARKIETDPKYPVHYAFVLLCIRESPDDPAQLSGWYEQNELGEWQPVLVPPFMWGPILDNPLSVAKARCARSTP